VVVQNVPPADPDHARPGFVDHDLAPGVPAQGKARQSHTAPSRGPGLLWP
jgi:hypothetical protein